jgi:hypothetical protein
VLKKYFYVIVCARGNDNLLILANACDGREARGAAATGFRLLLAALPTNAPLHLALLLLRWKGARASL